MQNLRFTLLTLLLLIALPAAGGWDPDDQKRLLEQAPETIERFREEDPSLQRFFDHAAGWAVFPNVGKGGFLVGGAYGKGVVYAGGRAIGYSELKQVTIGLQLGGQSYSELVFFRDQASLSRFKSEKVEFDAQLSAVAIDKGAAANADYHAGVAVFTLPRGGLMAEASVGGQSFTFSPR